MFSDVFYAGNKAKAQEIATAITAAARTACELQPQRDPITEAANAKIRAAEQEEMLFGEFLAEYDPTNEARKYLTEGQFREEFGRWRRARDGERTRQGEPPQLPNKVPEDTARNLADPQH